MSKQKVFVLTINHRHSNDTGAFSTYEKAYAAVATYCRDNWSEVEQQDDLSSEPPADDITCVNQYFEAQKSFFVPETYAIEELPIQ
jgi:hypothetical protein